MPVWPEQFARYGDGSPHVLALGEGSIQKRAQTLSAAAQRPEPLVVVCNYDAAWQGGLRTLLLGQRWGIVVADESHRLAAPGGRQSMFARELAKRTEHRLALTGTPLSSGPLSLYGQYRFLDPSVFSGDGGNGEPRPMNFTQFRARYAVMGGYGNHQVFGYTRLDELSAKMYTIAYRAEAAVLDLLPPIDERLECELEPASRKLYRELETEFVAELAAGGTVTTTNTLVKMLRLQQISSGTLPDDNGVPRKVSTAKAGALADALDALDATEPCVVFVRFRADLDAVHEVARKQGRASLELSGRVNELARWQAGDAPVLAVQIQAGGTGIDLTRARYCILFSLGFSLAQYDQARARLHRPGQTRHVTYIHIVARGTIDDLLYRALARKANDVRSVLHPELATGRDLLADAVAAALTAFEMPEY